MWIDIKHHATCWMTLLLLTSSNTVSSTSSCPASHTEHAAESTASLKLNEHSHTSSEAPVPFNGTNFACSAVTSFTSTGSEVKSSSGVSRSSFSGKIQASKLFFPPA
ncbi:hypothetical protein BV898_06813 [Hypsibius exemplaris]|uniref:Secreted protein n=1 Tax=Hypsibius exemplaris TaxID=2072580 RepID=A0A1W0WVE9_HYPEX|nr:hypothetical protein BV898_06813 [Hypsibius exemplaris]